MTAIMMTKENFNHNRWIMNSSSFDDVFIPTALADGDLARADQLHHLIGLGAVAHQIAETGDRVDAELIDVAEHRFGGGEVGVQAGDNGVGHGAVVGDGDSQRVAGSGAPEGRCGACCSSSTASLSRQSAIVASMPAASRCLPCTTSRDRRCGRPSGGATRSSGWNWVPSWLTIQLKKKLRPSGRFISALARYTSP